VRNTELFGVLPVLATPFNADWSIDEVALQQEIEWIYRQSADGVVVAMVSEISRLAIDERRRLADSVCAANAARGPVVLSVGAESTALAVQLAHHAERSGASAVMANSPLAARPDDAGLLGYFDAIVNAVDLPLIIQDSSGYAGAPLSLAVQVELFERHGRDRIMFKPESPPTGLKLSALHAATGGNAYVFEGSGGLTLVDAYRRGLSGVMPGPDLVWALVPMWRALSAGDDATVHAIGVVLAQLLSLIDGLDGYVALHKYLLVKQGALPDARARGPVGFALDPIARSEIDRLFDDLAVIVHEHAQPQPQPQPDRVA
jgi:dihydrodipicolinate synthase/N-acetylneuraminate lyase